MQIATEYKEFFPVLGWMEEAFEYQVIFNGRDLDRPVNYSLARIMPEDDWDIPPEARPVIIIDPRAGHGPGVGGFKKESEVGLAMKKNTRFTS